MSRDCPTTGEIYGAGAEAMESIAEIENSLLDRLKVAVRKDLIGSAQFYDKRIHRLDGGTEQRWAIEISSYIPACETVGGEPAMTAEQALDKWIEEIFDECVSKG
jgi:hypothetical protein